MNLVGIDYAILGVVGISALFGVLRGFVREALALFAWIVSYLVATHFADALTPFFEQFIKLPWLPFAASLATLFFGTMIATGLIIYLIRKLIFETGVSGGGTDRLVGLLFGAVRGVVVVGMIVMGLRVTPLPQTESWQQSLLIEQMVPVAAAMQRFLPEDIQPYFAKPCCEASTPVTAGKDKNNSKKRADKESSTQSPAITVNGVKVDANTLNAAKEVLKHVKIEAQPQTSEPQPAANSKAK
jgi:membrane protein required for colicin V production